MKTEIVNSRTFFSERSSKKTPNFSPSKAGKLVEVENETKKNGSRGNAYKHTKTGFRTDIALNVRSNWEANFVRILKAYDIKFEFEPTVFSFPIKRGTRGYTPDFFINKTGEWVEIKGYLDTKSKVKLKRFKRYYPKEFEKLICIISKYSKDAREFMEELEVPVVIYYEDIRTEYSSLVVNWEGK